jgi:cell division protein FtsB
MIPSAMMIAFIQRHLGAMAIPGICGLVITYFAYHAIHGNHGLYAWTLISHQIEQRQYELDKLTAVRERLEKRASLLQPQGIDPDMLDERARATLGLARPDEIVIFSDD